MRRSLPAACLLAAHLLSACLTAPPAPPVIEGGPLDCDEAARRGDPWRGTPPPVEVGFGTERLLALRDRIVGISASTDAPLARVGLSEHEPDAFCVALDGGHLLFESGPMGGRTFVDGLSAARGEAATQFRCGPFPGVRIPELDAILSPSEAAITARWGTPTADPDDPARRVWHHSLRCACGTGSCERAWFLSGRFVDGGTEALRWGVATEPVR